MSTYKSFAVVGGGMIGLPIVNALAAKNVSVILLSRPGSSAKTVPSGVKVVPTDLQHTDAVAKVLREHNVDVVLSTIATSAVVDDVQTTLVDASKLAGVKLFVPSEYGLPTEGQSEGALRSKAQIAKYLKSVGIPSTRVYVGMWTDVIPILLNLETKPQIIGKGETKFSITAVADIAGAVAHALTTASPSELENRELRLEGERVTLNQLAALFKVTPEYVDTITQGQNPQFLQVLMREIEAGKGSTGWDAASNAEGTGIKAAGSGNALWPGHQWLTVKDVFKL
ncbi:NmrA domain-containing protein [Favolaschia claudopus]|uniref:NmrA domain-containing protein n=1 Tax=Favolaschia claudopus TaxID=2862362 RepID=A0AAW0D1I0_9AGAR